MASYPGHLTPVFVACSTIEHGGGHAISTGSLLDAYLLHNTEEGLGVEKGSQSVGRSFGPTPGQQLMK